MTTQLQTPKTQHSVKLLRMEVVKPDKETAKRWFELTEQSKQVYNFIYQQWLVWHVNNDSPRKLREWLTARRELGVKQAGHCPVEGVPKDFAKQVYHDACEVFPNMHVRTIDIMRQSTLKELGKKKAAKGSLPGHTAILLCNQNVPSCTKNIPIRFDVSCSEIEPPAEANGDYHLNLRIWRQPRDGKRATSILDRLRLWCRGRKVRSQVVILNKIACGEYKFCGSSLMWSASNRKWFVHLAYQMPSKVVEGLDPKKVAVLLADTERPWRLSLPRQPRHEWLIGSGRPIGHYRHRIFLTRRKRSEYYRQAATNSKGHGRKRANQWRELYSEQWKNLVKRYNHVATTRAVEKCIELGIGALIYVQPKGDFKETRFLSVTGKDGHYNDATTWDWYQVASMLQYKCERAGIECECVSYGDDVQDVPGVR